MGTWYATYERQTTPRLSVKEQMFLMKRLSFLASAGVPLLESLSMIAEQTLSRRHARVLTSVIADISNGSSLARSFSKFDSVFGDYAVNIVRIGESSGTLSENLNYLADELKKRHSLKQKIIGALVYPIVITLATIGITGFLMLYLFPKIMPIFASLHMELPLTTKIVIAVSTFLQAWGLWTMLALIAILITIIVVRSKSQRFRYLLDGWMLGMPLFGEMLRSYNLANATRTLGLLIKSGMTLAEALPLTADTTQNLVYKAEYRKAGEAIIRGEQLSKSFFLNSFLFPPVLSQMISVGERSGSLSNTLIYLSELYESEVEEFSKNLSSLIEPALMVMMGLVVGFIAVAIITPIYGITQNLHP